MNNQTALSTQAQPKAEVRSGGVLAALTPQSIDDAFRLAKALAMSGDMIPKHFQGKPEATMAAIVRGMEIGLAPMQALSSIAVINGRASLWGDAMPALMQRAGHHIDVEMQGEGDKVVAVATLTRGDTGKHIVRSFSMADAKRAGLLQKPGPWTQYTTRMLQMRARTLAIRDGAADALMGMQVAEEVADYGPDAARDVTPTAPKRGGVIFADPDPVIDEIHEGQPAEEHRSTAEMTDEELQQQAAAEAQFEAERRAREIAAE